MLNLILGRAKTGKTTRIFDLVRREGQHRPQVLLVPEQVSHDAERQLCALCGPAASRCAEVLSFTRLAHRVFTKSGGLAVPQLDAGGRLLLMSQAVAAVSGSLKAYARPSQKAAFLEQLLATGDELKSYCVRPEELIGLPLLMPRGGDYAKSGSRILGLKPEQLHVAATYSLIFNAGLMAADGIGYVVGLDQILELGEGSELCFRPLEPAVTGRMNVVWKRYQMMSRQAEAFLEELRESE